MTRLRIRRPALETIHELVDEHGAATETGGILLGRHDAGTIEIMAAGDPGPQAKHTSTSFTRDLIHAQRLAAGAWVRDGRQWIGEWHTHPAGAPVPSTTDLATYRHLLETPDLAFSAFVSLIVQPSPARMSSWIITRNSATCVPCTLT